MASTTTLDQARSFVLLVEDDELVTRSLRRVLEPSVTLFSAATLAEARPWAMNPDCDAIILDLQLPDGSGLDLLRDIRTAGRNAPIAIYSGFLQDEVVVPAVGYGATCFAKASSTEMVCTWVLEALELRRYGRSRLERVTGRLAAAHDLTATETEILRRYVAGVRRELLTGADRSEASLKKHIERILEKTGVERMEMLVTQVYREATYIDEYR